MHGHAFQCLGVVRSCGVLLDDHPDGVDDPRQVGEQGQDEADPELQLHVHTGHAYQYQ